MLQTNEKGMSRGVLVPWSEVQCAQFILRTTKTASINGVVCQSESLSLGLLLVAKICRPRYMASYVMCKFVSKHFSEK